MPSDHKQFSVPSNGKFVLSSIKTDGTDGFKKKEDAHDKLESDVALLYDLQEKLYAENRHGVLIILQAMDTAGKDGAIKHVMTGVNPQGVDVHNFRAPNSEEISHDFLWRASRMLPEKGKIGIFNRSYYEEVLAVRVHPEFLTAEKLPSNNANKIWPQRYEDINNFERYLTHNGILVLKFFLHISKQEQKKRLLSRVEDKDKHFKVSLQDEKERVFWKDYMKAYEEMIRHTSTEDAPWFVIPSDHKWFTRVIVADVVVNALKKLDPKFPKPTKESDKIIRTVKRSLMNEK
jgi:PPK2 family polyphosphate:nucleotide phosphotransferase